MPGGQPSEVVFKVLYDFSDILSGNTVLRKELLKLAASTGLPPDPRVKLKSSKGGFKDVSGTGQFVSFPPAIMEQFAQGMAEGLRRSFDKTTSLGRQSSDPDVRRGIEIAEEKKVERLRQAGMIDRGELVIAELVKERDPKKPPPFIKAPPVLPTEFERQSKVRAPKFVEAPPVIPGQIPGQLTGFNKAGFMIDKMSTKFLKMANNNHKTNAQISDSAQLFLALGGILAPISPLLGRMSLQAGFSAFALGGVGIALTGISITVGAAIQGLSLWVRSTFGFIKSAREAGAVTGRIGAKFDDLSNAASKLSVDLGVKSAESFKSSAASMSRLTAMLSVTDGAAMALQGQFSDLADNMISSVAIPLEGVIDTANDAESKFGGVTIATQAWLENAGKVKTFLDGMGAIGDYFATAPMDAFITDLTRFEQTMLLSNQALQKFSHSQGKAQLSNKQQFEINQRNRVRSVKNEHLTMGEAAKASAIERAKLFKDSFQPALTSLMDAASGIVKEVIDPKEPGNAAIKREQKILEDIRDGIQELVDPDRSVAPIVSAAIRLALP